MGTNYERIGREHLSRLFTQLPVCLESMLHAEKRGDLFYFRAFGRDCCFGPDKITLSGKHIVNPRVVHISLYAIPASPERIRLEPFISFRDFPNSMPYEVPVRTNSERMLVSHVRSVKEKQQTIKDTLDGKDVLVRYGSDLSFVLFPFPKIVLCYIFYLPDEEF